MFTQAGGEMFDWLQRSGREMSDCGFGSPVKHLERCGVLRRNLLATHVNYLAHGDAALLAKRKVSVIHCPRSHEYFNHEAFPLGRLLRAGVNVCLGTDSLASVLQSRRQNIELDMLEEMRLLANRQRWLSPTAILRMATTGSARALSRAGTVGELAAGAFADLIVLRSPAKRTQAAEAVLEHRGPVAASMIGGAWVIPPR
jgi:cytosine/adenosine deaminase-related metal-dependent hydrolase